MSSERELDDWLDAYLTYTENTEPPLSYHTWVGISLIAGALQRKVYLNWGHETIYPNMYIVLVGPSGKARKGTALTIGKDILQDIGISLTSESITREALIRDMKDALDSFQDETTGKLRYHCALTAISDELSVFLGQNDVKFLADLTDWYDSRKSWTYRTKGAGTDKIQGVCFNILGATAPDWLQSILPQEAVGGGFTSRIIFVVEEDKGKIVPEPIYTREDEELRGMLVRDLERISTLTGEMRFSDKGKQKYINWYKKYENDMREGKVVIEDTRFTGYMERKATHLRKLSMVLSAARSSERVITEDDLSKALSLLSQAEKKMPKTFGGLGTSQYSDITNKVLNLIQSRGELTRSNLMRKMYRDLDPGTLDVVETTMRQMKVVEVVSIPGKGDVLYKWKGD